MQKKMFNLIKNGILQIPVMCFTHHSFLSSQCCQTLAKATVSYNSQMSRAVLGQQQLMLPGISPEVLRGPISSRYLPTDSIFCELLGNEACTHFFSQQLTSLLLGRKKKRRRIQMKSCPFQLPFNFLNAEKLQLIIWCYVKGMFHLPNQALGVICVK